MPIFFDDAVQVQSVAALQHNVSNALKTAQAMLDQEHTADGEHTDITVDSITSRTGEPVEVSTGLRFTSGPWLLDDHSSSQSSGSVIATFLTANQPRLAPQGYETCVVIELDSGAPRTIFGLGVAPALRTVRQLRKLVNRGNVDFTLESNSGSATNSYERMYFGGGDYLLKSGTVVELYYDPGAPIWRGPQPPTAESASMIIRRFTVNYDFSTGGTQNFSPPADLTNYLQATITRCYRTDGLGFFVGGAAIADVNPFFTSNSNLRIQGPTVAAGTITLTIEYLEQLD